MIIAVMIHLTESITKVKEVKVLGEILCKVKFRRRKNMRNNFNFMMNL